MKKLIIAAAIAAPALAIATPTPANAAAYHIVHDNDGGYDAPFRVACYNGSLHDVAEGHDSIEFCGDTEKIYVHSDEEIHCLFNGVWNNTYDAVGWHLVKFSQHCVAQRD